MSCINLMANHVWSEADIEAHGRALIDVQISPARRGELQTILLGHISQMRIATPIELEEIAQANAEARADMALLLEVMAIESAKGVGLDLTTEPVKALYLLRNPVVAE